MNILKESFVLWNRVFVGALFMLFGFLPTASGSVLATLAGWLTISAMIYTGWNLLKLVRSLFKWIKIRKDLRYLFKSVFHSDHAAGLTVSASILFGEAIRDYLKFTFITLLWFWIKFLINLLTSVLFGQQLVSMSSSRRASSSSSASSYTPKNQTTGCVEGQIVYCENCGRMLPMGATYDPSRPRCNSCFFA